MTLTACRGPARKWPAHLWTWTNSRLRLRHPAPCTLLGNGATSNHQVPHRRLHPPSRSLRSHSFPAAVRHRLRLRLFRGHPRPCGFWTMIPFARARTAAVQSRVGPLRLRGAGIAWTTAATSTHSWKSVARSFSCRRCLLAWERAPRYKGASRCGRHVGSRSCHTVLRNTSHSGARQGRRRKNMIGWPTPLPELIVRDEQPRLAPAAKPPLGLSPPCSLWTRARICSGPRNSSPPLREHRPTATRSWTLLRPMRTGTDPLRACIVQPSLLLVQLAFDRSTSLNCLVHAALAAPLCRLSAGSLPPAATWLTRTRLCWQHNKNGKPGTIKMGELLRSVYAQQLVNQHPGQTPHQGFAHAPVVHQPAGTL